MYISNLLKTLEKIQFGSLHLILPDNSEHYFKGAKSGTAAQFTLKDMSIVSEIFATGNVGLARTYKEGLWETENLTALMQFGIENQQQTNLGLGTSVVKKLLWRFHYMLRHNSLRGSRRNIASHYDLGNDFYALWLDESMTYSSALFQNKNETLQQAQMNKYDRLLKRLDSGAENILEIGCGWGGFAGRLLSTTSHNVKGITLSRQQCNYANKKLQCHQNRCQIELQDYRSENKKYDSIVSIEMFEAVGEAYWQTYFNKIKNLLEKNGKALIQTITIEDERFNFYRKGGDMIRSFIFPGGLLPSPSIFESHVVRSNLQIANKFEFGKSYALTLEHWLQKFNENKHLILGEKYDEKFLRLWQFYLSFCIAGFRSGRTNVMQVELVHA